MNTINTQTLEINRVPFSRMLKSEMADYAEKATAIVDKYETNSDLIGHVFGLLEKQKPQIELLRISYGIDTERLKVDSLKAEMMLTISGLKLKVKKLSRSNLKLDLHAVENAINSHLRYLNNTKNDKQLIQKIAGFFDLLDKSEEVFTAFSEFDLLRETDEIKMALSKVEEAAEKRVKLLSKRSKEPTRNIMKGLHNAVNNLFKAIEVSHLAGYPLTSEEGGEQSDFTELINELSQLSDMYNRSIGVRLANNKRKLDREKEREEGKENLEGADGTEQMAAAMRFDSTLDDEENKIKPFAVMANLVKEDVLDDADEDESDDDDDDDAADYE